MQVSMMWLSIHSQLEKNNVIPISGLKFEDVKAIYGHTNQQIELQLTRISYFFFAKFTPASLCLPNFVLSFVNYFATDLGNDAFVLPIFMWFPFEWNDPIRYVLITVLQYTMVDITMIPISCTVSVVIGSLLWLQSIEKDIDHGLNGINANMKKRKTQKRIPKQLLDFVKLHTDAKQLSPNAQGAVSIHS